MSIIYKKGSLFEASKGSILVHSCNAQGVWGKGIAAEFKKRFPISYELYRLGCLDEDATGLGIVLPEEKGYNVGCLITSKNYDKLKDPVDVILQNTKAALEMVLNSAIAFKYGEINSCQFNSGLFNVPWHETEKVLVDVMKEIGYTKSWTVWSL